MQSRVFSIIREIMPVKLTVRVKICRVRQTKKGKMNKYLSKTVHLTEIRLHGEKRMQMKNNYF